MRNLFFKLFVLGLLSQVPCLHGAESNNSTLKAISRMAKEGDYDSALKSINQYISKSPNDPRAYKIRGHFYFAQKKYPEALSDFTHVITISPESANAYVDRAGVYYALEDYDKALADVDLALELKPKSAFALMLKGAILDAKKPDSTPKFRLRKKGEKLK